MAKSSASSKASQTRHCSSGGFQKGGFKDKVAKVDCKGLPLRIMFQDEARFGRINNLKSCWAPKNVRPKLQKQIVREYVYVFGAVSPKDGRHDSLIMPYANTAAMSMYLAEISNRYLDEYILMFMDQAGWHKAKDLVIPTNIELAYLPPYSPELNPQEQIWDELREKFFTNRFFNSIEDVEYAATLGLQHLEAASASISRLTTRSWM